MTEVIIKKKELVFSLTRKDFDFEYFRAGGKGGQKQNVTDSGARCRHKPSGAVAESRTYRTQKENKRSAFKKCAESKEFQSWCRSTALKLPSIDSIVDEMMDEENLVIEYGV